MPLQLWPFAALSGAKITNYITVQLINPCYMWPFKYDGSSLYTLMTGKDERHEVFTTPCSISPHCLRPVDPLLFRPVTPAASILTKYTKLPRKSVLTFHKCWAP